MLLFVSALIYLYTLTVLLFSIATCSNTQFVIKDNSVNPKGLGFSNQIARYDGFLGNLVQVAPRPLAYEISCPLSCHIGTFHGNCTFFSFFRIKTLQQCEQSVAVFKDRDPGACRRYLDFLENTVHRYSQPEARRVTVSHDFGNICTLNKSARYYNNTSVFQHAISQLNGDALNVKVQLHSRASDFKRPDFLRFFHVFDFIDELHMLAHEAKIKVLGIPADKPMVVIHIRQGDLKGYCQLFKFNDCHFDTLYHKELISKLQSKHPDHAIVIIAEDNVAKSYASSATWLSATSLLDILKPLDSVNFTCLRSNIQYAKLFVEYIIAGMADHLYVNRYSSMSKLLSYYHKIQTGGKEMKFIDNYGEFNTTLGTRFFDFCHWEEHI